MITEDSGEALRPSQVPFFQVAPSAAVATDRDPTPPRYVSPLAERAAQLGIDGLESLDWLDVGAELRTRYENRGYYYHDMEESGDRLLTRSRFYLGVREVLDPLRVAIEIQDARYFGTDFSDNTTDYADILKLYGELYFPDVGDEGHPLRFRVGRMSFDSIDRRLVARNRFRNTTHAFDGARLTWGERATDWEIDTFAVMPVDITPESPDRSSSAEWLYGLTGYWRGWAPYWTLEPYYFILDKDRTEPDIDDQTLHTMGLHGFGVLGQTGFDGDFNTAFQWGRDGDLTQRAFAMHGEVGYTFDRPSSPRAAFWVNYASGDDDPNDGVNERFDRLFGASHTMYGHSDLFTWQNMVNPTAYFSIRPAKPLRFEVFYRWYWLASDTDAWVVPGLRDEAGGSGDFIGQELDLRVRYQIRRHLGLDAGCAYFMPGEFVDNTARDANNSCFFYLQLTLRL